MTKLIAICDATEPVKNDYFVGRLIDHLEMHFSPAKRLERSQISAVKDRRSQAVYTLASSIVAPSVEELFGARVGSCKDDRLPSDIVRTLVKSRAFSDWSYTTEVKYNCPDTSHDFIVIDAGIDNAFLTETSLSPLSDIIIVLDDYVSQDSNLLEFTCAAVEHLQNCRLSVVVYSETDTAKALDIFCQFEASVSPSNLEELFFLGHLPKYKKGHNFNTREIIALQNIVLSLLKLNYQPIPHNITTKMSKGSLH